MLGLLGRVVKVDVVGVCVAALGVASYLWEAVVFLIGVSGARVGRLPNASVLLGGFSTSLCLVASGGAALLFKGGGGKALPRFLCKVWGDESATTMSTDLKKGSS